MRPWFKNQIYAPGAYTGYGVKTIPAVRESIESPSRKSGDKVRSGDGPIRAAASGSFCFVSLRPFVPYNSLLAPQRICATNWSVPALSGAE